MKILNNENLNEKDELWIKELAEASGWDKEDIIEELKNIDTDPSERSERYRKLFEIYSNEAQEFLAILFQQPLSSLSNTLSICDMRL